MQVLNTVLDGRAFALIALFPVLGIAFSYVYVKLRRKRKWPTAEGRIIGGEVAQKNQAVIYFKFVVAGQAHAGRYKLLIEYPNDYLQRWRPETSVVVRYRRSNPDYSFLAECDNKGISAGGIHYGPENILYCGTYWSQETNRSREYATRNGTT
jgi:hypothetical protein